MPWHDHAVFDPAHLDDDQLRAALAEAERRLPHHEVCPHCTDPMVDARAMLAALRHEIDTVNERAAAAGYVINQDRKLVHRWDCPSIQSYLRQVSDVVDSFTLDGPASMHAARQYGPAIPTVADQATAREFLRGGRGGRRTCRTCSPDL